MRRKIASSRRLKSKMRRNLLSLRPVKPRGPALRVSFPRKNTTLSLFLPLVREGRCWNEERGKERKEKKQSVGQREWMEEGTRHFSVRHPALSGLPLCVWIKGRAPFALPCVCACVCDKKRQNFVTMERAKGRWCSNLGKSFVGHEAGEEGLRINRPSGERLLTFQNL